MRTVLVPLMQGRVLTCALDAACALAALHDGEVRVLVGRSTTGPLTLAAGHLDAVSRLGLERAVDAAAEDLAARARALLRPAEVRWRVDVAGTPWLEPGRQALLHARVADAVVLGRTEAPTEGERRLFGTLLLGAGRPVLLVPPATPSPVRLGRVAVAWKPVREAVRAVHDALPVLVRADEVEVLTVGAPDDEEARAEAASADILDLLRAHGVRPRAVALPQTGHGTGEAILAHAREAGSDLLVAGGYGRARVVEQVFGGVTRTLSERAHLPVWFSH
ncbi:universal stress protein [Coralloluteibacterium thermophilus]|uniref:Universal stress protein n=1 Tax=Coralloluteibacterium thermophilum TaxID=2707049 RepID=A0ABV9NLC8_9GAMM